MNDYNNFRVRAKLPPLAPPSKYRRQRGISLSDSGYDGLRELAAELGYSGPVGGNVTALLEALGHGLWSLTAKPKEDD